jgi:hypothetical protein
MNISIIMEDGFVKRVLADGPANVVVVDFDSNTEEEKTLRTINGRKAYIHEWIHEAELTPEEVESIYTAAGRELEAEPCLEARFLAEQLEEYLSLQGIELNPEQKKEVLQGVQHWLNETLKDAFADSLNDIIRE